MIDKKVLREAADAVRELRFIQAAVLAGLKLEKREVVAGKAYMSQLARLQAELEKSALEERT